MSRSHAKRKLRKQNSQTTPAPAKNDQYTHDQFNTDLKLLRSALSKADENFILKRRAAWSRNVKKGVIPSPQQNNPGQRQGSETDEDKIRELTVRHGLIEPEYNFHDLFDLIECSDCLSVAIAFVAQAVAGNGHTFSFGGDDRTEADSEIEQFNYARLRSFFANPNENGSFRRVAIPLVTDVESVGNGALEVVPGLAGQPEQLFHLPITYMKMTMPDELATPYIVTLLRDGKPIEVVRYKRFRRYARVFPDGRIVWFKEFGDPRIVDRVTGEYVEQTANPATECWWFKIPFRNAEYGVPRWIGLQDVVKARILAHYVNWDVFRSQGVPPLLIAVEGGVLTDGSIQELNETIESWKGAEQWNKTVVLQVIPLEDMSLGDSSAVKPTIKIEKLRDARAEDFMWEKFLDYSEGLIWRAWRLAPLMRGASGEASLAAASTATIIAEQYLLIPLRDEYNEEINSRLIRGKFKIFNWEFKLLATKATGTEELATIIRTVALSGGATMNNVIDLANNMLGTSWSKDNSPISNIPVVWALALARLGRIHITDDNKVVVLTPRQAQGTLAMAGEPETDNTQSGSAVATPAQATVAGQGKRVRGRLRGLFKQVEDELFERLLGEIEDDFEAWEPGEITEQDLAL